MAILSSAVSAGDDILASSYNNLRTDLLTGDITIAGVKSFSGIPVFSEGVTIAATKKLYLDGGDDTYISEVTANNISFVAGGLTVFRALSTQTLDLNGDLALQSTKKLYLDGGGDTYIVESAADNIQFLTGGTVALQLDNAQGVIVFATKKLYLDSGGDTYIVEGSSNSIDFYVAGSNRFSIDEPEVKIKTTLLLGTSGTPWSIGQDVGAADRLEFNYGIMSRYYFQTDGNAYADLAWNTFSPDIKKDKKINNPDDQDYLLWALDDAKKPVKPYQGLPIKRKNITDKGEYIFDTKEEVDSEVSKYAKDIGKIAIGIAYWAEQAEARLKMLEGV